MKLHEDQKLFVQAIRATAQRMDIPEIFIEKDYWVTFALYLIFTDDIGDYTVFKGGTALSKCHNIIERFSEDIDLVILRNESYTSAQLTRKIRNISKKVGEHLPEIETEGITNKKGNIRKTAHEYPRTVKGTFGQVRDIIVLEATWLGYHEPYTNESVSSYIHDMMIDTEQEEMITTYNLSPFEVKVLSPKRTLCEKIMSLVRFSYDKDPIVSLGLKIRHIYDLHKMLRVTSIKSFFDSLAFLDMMLKVASDDIVCYKNNNSWLAHHPNEAILFADIDEVWSKLSKVYNASFAALIYGDLPSEDEIIKTIKSIKQRLENLDWSTISKQLQNDS